MLADIESRKSVSALKGRSLDALVSRRCRWHGCGGSPALGVGREVLARLAAMHRFGGGDDERERPTSPVTLGGRGWISTWLDGLLSGLACLCFGATVPESESKCATGCSSCVSAARRPPVPRSTPSGAAAWSQVGPFSPHAVRQRQGPSARCVCPADSTCRRVG